MTSQNTNTIFNNKPSNEGNNQARAHKSVHLTEADKEKIKKGAKDFVKNFGPVIEKLSKE